MFKQILALLMLVVLVVKSENIDTTPRTDDYINLNRKQYAANIKSYDLQMETFKKNYAGQINTIYIQRDLLINGQIQNDEYLDPLEVLSEFNKHCIAQYRSLIPTSDSVELKINTCANTATSYINTVLNGALSTRNVLQNYYTNNFEKQITNCNTTYANQKLKYSDCATSVITTTNTYTIDNQKTFSNQMDTAECSADGYLKNGLYCSYSVYNSTISLMTEANTMINICLKGLNANCNSSTLRYSCSNVFKIPQSQVHYKNLTIINPFFGRSETDCLMLSIY